MGDDSGKPLEEKPATPATNPTKKFIEDAGLLHPFVKAVFNLFYIDGKLNYHGLVISVIVASVIGWYAYSKGFDSGEKNIESVKGELREVTEDRNAARTELAPYAALAMQIYTNVPIDKRLDFFTSQFISFKTNLLTEIESEKPYFNLYINNRLVTNGSTVFLKRNQNLDLVVQNISSVTADKITVECFVPPGLADTNFIFDFSWKRMSPAFAEENGVIGTNALANSWEWISDDSIGGNRERKQVNPFSISTTFPYSNLGVRFKVFASLSKLQDYGITLNF